jgi:hypothetical protein
LSQGRSPLWRAVRQIFAVLIAAIIPQPSIAELNANAQTIHYRLRDPPRRRKLQSMPVIPGLT